MQITEIETIHIDIPKGISKKEMIVLSNRGHMINENIIGDIKVSINILPHNIFKREGNDLVFCKKLSLKESLCGFSLEIKHLNGKMLNMNNLVNPTIIKPGYKKIVPDMGMITNQQTGNLIIEFEIEFPDKLEAEKIEALQNIL
jgi:DnaJ family protein A protein 2